MFKKEGNSAIEQLKFFGNFFFILILEPKAIERSIHNTTAIQFKQANVSEEN